MSKKCPWCKVNVYLTELKHWYKCPECQMEFPERAFPKEITVFDRITSSPEVLAPKFVHEATTCDGDGHVLSGYKSTIIAGFWLVEPEAIAATVAKLKEVCDAEKN